MGMLSKEPVAFVLFLNVWGFFFFLKIYLFLLEKLFCFKWKRELEVRRGREQQEWKANW